MKSILPLRFTQLSIVTTTLMLSACGNEQSHESVANVELGRTVEQATELVESTSVLTDSESLVTQAVDVETDFKSVVSDRVIDENLGSVKTEVQTIKEEITSSLKPVPESLTVNDTKTQEVIAAVIETPKVNIQAMTEGVVEKADAIVLTTPQPVLKPSVPVFLPRSGSWTKKSQKIQGKWRIEQRAGDTYLVLGDDFKTRNAPDLKFVLSNQSVSDVSGRNAMQGVVFISDLTSAKGAQEYKLPANYTDYKTLLLHCEKYTKLWGAADIQ